MRHGVANMSLLVNLRVNLLVRHLYTTTLVQLLTTVHVATTRSHHDVCCFSVASVASDQ